MNTAVTALRETVTVCVCGRCEDMVDVRRLKMLQMVQLFKCEEDALQVGQTTDKKQQHFLYDVMG